MFSVWSEVIGDVRQIGIASLQMLCTTDGNRFILRGMKDIKRCLGCPRRTDRIPYYTGTLKAFIEPHDLRMGLIHTGRFEPTLQVMVETVEIDLHHRKLLILDISLIEFFRSGCENLGAIYMEVICHIGAYHHEGNKCRHRNALRSQRLIIGNRHIIGSGACKTSLHMNTVGVRLLDDAQGPEGGETAL